MRACAGLIVALAICLARPRGVAREPTLTEYEVKSLFLMNFAKYVDWPATAFGPEAAPFVIGLYGGEKFGDALSQAARGRTVSGRPIVIVAATPEEVAKFHILYIGESDETQMSRLLDQTSGFPVLTVGETEQFVARDGMIRFVKREGKVRLEINAASVRRSKLEISSKLLNVADVVRGGSK